MASVPAKGLQDHHSLKEVHHVQSVLNPDIFPSLDRERRCSDRPNHSLQPARNGHSHRETHLVGELRYIHLDQRYLNQLKSGNSTA